MKLLIITQKVDVNDDVLGFFHGWLEKFAEKLDKLYVICLSQGEYQLPENVKVCSLGKEKSFSKLRQFFRLQKFLLRHIREVDGIFIHMCPIYALAAFPLAKVFRKKLILWYAHGKISRTLKLALLIVDKIVTSSKDGCRLKSSKIEVLGQGIDTGLFKPLDVRRSTFDETSNLKPRTSNLLYVGRISPIKNLETLIKAMDILINQKEVKDIEVKVVGQPILEIDKEYSQGLRKLIREKALENYIKFLGSIPFQKIVNYYQEAHLFVNPSQTGSLDKTVLEAMACGKPVLTCNEAFKPLLEEKYLFEARDFNQLAQKIISLRDQPQDTSLREIVVRDHSLEKLINKISAQF